MVDKKFTMFAAQAMTLADIFKAVFADGLPGSVHYKVELSAPDGPSTGGGKLALQHVKLIPDGGGATLVMGSANPVEKTAEIRTFPYLADMHRQRFKGASLPIDPERYKALQKQLQFFFTDQGMTVVMIDVSKPDRPELPEPAPRTSPLVWLALGAFLLLVAVAVAYAALR